MNVGTHNSTKIVSGYQSCEKDERYWFETSTKTTLTALGTTMVVDVDDYIDGASSSVADSSVYTNDDGTGRVLTRTNVEPRLSDPFEERRNSHLQQRSMQERFPVSGNNHPAGDEDDTFSKLYGTKILNSSPKSCRADVGDETHDEDDDTDALDLAYRESVRQGQKKNISEFDPENVLDTENKNKNDNETTQVQNNHASTFFSPVSHSLVAAMKMSSGKMQGIRSNPSTEKTCSSPGSSPAGSPSMEQHNSSGLEPPRNHNAEMLSMKDHNAPPTQDLILNCDGTVAVSCITEAFPSVVMCPSRADIEEPDMWSSWENKNQEPERQKKVCCMTRRKFMILLLSIMAVGVAVIVFLLVSAFGGGNGKANVDWTPSNQEFEVLESSKPSVAVLALTSRPFSAPPTPKLVPSVTPRPIPPIPPIVVLPPTSQPVKALNNVPAAIARINESVFLANALADPQSPQSKALAWLSLDSQASNRILPTERLVQRWALATFAESTGWTQWTDNSRWLQDSNECEWHGIGCNARGAVESITLISNALTGIFPLELSLLGNELLILDLTDNSLSGRLGLQLLKRLPKLRTFSVGRNNMKGFLPRTIGTMTSLQKLDLQRNQFTGDIPGQLKRLTQLTSVNL